MSDWKIVCLKCGTVTTYREMSECGGCPECGGGNFKVDPADMLKKSNQDNETIIAS